MNFNSKPSTILHIDLNSCFATIEQQANPYLRGKAIAVAAYPTPNGCILAPSIEAKHFGVKTGMRVKDGKALCPQLIILSSDPWKYRNIHLSLRDLLAEYTAEYNPKSIDEFVLNLEGYPKLMAGNMRSVASEIKKRIKNEIGEWLTVSVGIAPNRFLAKLASSLHKPDGLDEINKCNFMNCYSNLKLTDLPYIKERNAARLFSMGVYSVVDFYKAPVWKLKAAFQSINGYYWYLRLRGYEIDSVVFGRRSYGNSYALPKPFSSPSELSPILTKLVEKMGARLRRAGYKAQGIHLAILYRDGSFWHRGFKTPEVLFDSRDFYKAAFALLLLSPGGRAVSNLAVSCFNLSKHHSTQLKLFDDVIKRERVVRALDSINNRWGSFIVTPARMIATEKFVPDRIAFGGVKELEEFTLSQ